MRSLNCWGSGSSCSSGLMHECIAHLCATCCHLSKGLCNPYISSVMYCTIVMCYWGLLKVWISKKSNGNHAFVCLGLEWLQKGVDLIFLLGYMRVKMEKSNLIRDFETYHVPELLQNWEGASHQPCNSGCETEPSTWKSWGELLSTIMEVYCWLQLPLILLLHDGWCLCSGCQHPIWL